MSVPAEQAQQAHTVGLPKRWPLALPFEARNANLLKDARILNGYVELDKTTGEYQVYKRFGLSTTPTLTLSNGATFELLFYDQVTSCLIAIEQNFGALSETVRIFNIAAGTSTTVSGGGLIDTQPFPFSMVAVGPVAAAQPTLFYHSVTKGYLLDPLTSSQVQITDTNFPPNQSTPIGLVYGAVELDGFVFVLGQDSNIWGTNSPNNAAVWSGTSSEPVTNDPSIPMALVRNLNYVVAFTLDCLQVYYNAGNALGSPLSPVPDAYMPYGCSFGPSTSSIDGKLLWVGTAYKGALQVIMMDELAPKIVSTPAVDKLLSKLLPARTPSGVQPNNATAAFAVGIWGWTLKLNGHRLYGLTCEANNFTLVYDIDQDFWVLWTDQNGNFWPIFAIAQSRSVATGHGNVASPTVYAYQNSTLNVVPLDAANVFPNDAGVVVPVDIYTPNLDLGTMRSKTMSAMYFNADRQPGYLQVRHSDDDYTTWSTFRRVNLAAKKPFITDEGTFEWRRAYHYRYSGNTDFRIASSDFQIDLGTA